MLSLSFPCDLPFLSASLLSKPPFLHLLTALCSFVSAPVAPSMAILSPLPRLRLTPRYTLVTPPLPRNPILCSILMAARFAIWVLVALAQFFGSTHMADSNSSRHAASPSNCASITGVWACSTDRMSSLARARVAVTSTWYSPHRHRYSRKWSH